MNGGPFGRHSKQEGCTYHYEWRQARVCITKPPPYKDSSDNARASSEMLDVYGRCCSVSEWRSLHDVHISQEQQRLGKCGASSKHSTVRFSRRSPNTQPARSHIL